MHCSLAAGRLSLVKEFGGQPGGPIDILTMSLLPGCSPGWRATMSDIAVSK